MNTNHAYKHTNIAEGAHDFQGPVDGYLSTAFFKLTNKFRSFLVFLLLLLKCLWKRHHPQNKHIHYAFAKRLVLWKIVYLFVKNRLWVVIYMCTCCLCQLYPLTFPYMLNFNFNLSLCFYSAHFMRRFFALLPPTDARLQLSRNDENFNSFLSLSLSGQWISTDYQSGLLPIANARKIYKCQ